MRNTMQFIDLAAQQARIKPQIDANIQKVLSHGQYILGPEVAELEDKLAAYCGAKHCIGVANGTDALQIALMALGVGAGDEVITPGFTYIATAETVALLGAKPVYVDIVEQTYNLNPAKLEAAITPRTKAIVPVSLYGQCADFDVINAIAARYNLPVIEDAAQSFGASYKGRKSGSLTTVSCTSFFPSKPLGCYGDGGAVFTDDDNLATVIRQIARHGQDRRYHHIRVGVNSRLDTLQAAILLPKLAILEEEIGLRGRVAAGRTVYRKPQYQCVCPIHRAREKPRCRSDGLESGRHPDRRPLSDSAQQAARRRIRCRAARGRFGGRRSVEPADAPVYNGGAGAAGSRRAGTGIVPIIFHTAVSGRLKTDIAFSDGL